MSAVRHKIATKARVCELYEAGWKPAEIRRLLQREGHPVPSPNTMWLWTHPRKAAQQAQRDLEKTRVWRTERASFSWPGVRGPEWKRARMLTMLKAGVCPPDVARVMSIDFPNDPPVTEDNVRRLWRTVRTPVGASPTPVLDLMCQLRKHAMPFPDVVGIVRMCHDVQLSPELARYYVREGREPRLPKLRAEETAAACL